jgi:hypothetical protein
MEPVALQRLKRSITDFRQLVYASWRADEYRVYGHQIAAVAGRDVLLAELGRNVDQVLGAEAPEVAADL